MFAASKTASASGGYQISRSLRFNSPDTAYLNRTIATTSNRQIFTLSFWCKLGNISTLRYLYSASMNGNNEFTIGFDTTNTLFVYDYQSAYYLSLFTTQLFRDPSAWYHIVVAIDTTQATSSNRAKIYVNGTQVTSFSTAVYPPQNYNTLVNSSSTNYNRFGSLQSNPPNYFDGYMTEINFIDGQALTPSSFGATDAQTGVWSPAFYRGAYGTNGFYLNFSDNSNTTAATLGKDYSGNGNNWTPNNFSVTAGSGNDSLVDSPTSYGTDTGAGGEVRGNYCTMNPLSAGSYVTLSNGNLQIVGNTATDSGVSLSTIGVTTGLWYWETICVTTGGLSYAGFGKLNSGYSSLNVAETFLASYGGGYRNGGQIYGADRQITTTSSFGDGDIIGIALDMTNGAAYLSKNGTFLNSGVPTSGSSKTGAVWAWTPSSMPYAICPAGGGYNNSSNYLNLGQRAFSYTAPSGFKALCTQNLPTPTVGATSSTQAGVYFNPVLYTGTGSSRSVTGVGFQPDWTWIKSTSTAGYNHHLVDAVRGVTKDISSNLTNAESTDTNGLTAFGSDGFTVGSSNEYNALNSTFVAWNWKANGAGSSNTSGSITSTVSASTTSGFSVATYTGTGLAGTIGHGLGVAPSMIIVKSRSATGAWPIYHSTLGNGSNLVLNTTAATATSSTIWNSTSPTSSVFSVGINTDSNTVTVTYVAYCFAAIAGYSAFGSYTGNGSTDGPFVFTGFKPAYIIRKRTDTTSNWLLQDRLRIGYNATTPYTSVIYGNLSDAEITFNEVDILSNGFKIRASDAFGNASGGTYIYMALAQNPFKYSLAR